MSTYIDSSFLVSLYVPDQHSAEAQRRLASSPPIWLTPLHVAEWTHAIEQQVFRGASTRAQADLVHEAFALNRAEGLWVQIALPDSIFDVCTQLAHRYGARFGLRTLDALHVASALELKAERFWTFDERQKKLARAAGLKTG